MMLMLVAPTIAIMIGDVFDDRLIGCSAWVAQ
jgi:hypothetical protein